MKPIKGYNAAQASGDFERLPAGGYVIKIKAVKDNEEKKYLKIVFDIAEGPERGRFKDIDKDHDFLCSFIRSYKETALGMFKRFIKAIDETEETNFNDFVETGLDEQDLVGNRLGVVFGYEEYNANDGNIKERLCVASVCSADRIRKGDFKVPEVKRLKADTAATIPEGFTALADSDLPF